MQTFSKTSAPGLPGRSRRSTTRWSGDFQTAPSPPTRCGLEGRAPLWLRLRRVAQCHGSALPASALEFSVCCVDETWNLFNSGAGLAAENMATDETLLEASASLGRPVLRFYSWTETAATFGYSQAYAEVARWTKLRPLVRRPTGGGLVPHDADWTYSLAFPPNHPWYSLKAVESYHRVHQWLQLAFERMGVATTLSACRQKSLAGQCFVGADQFDLLRDGQKIAGAAQRRNRQGLLIQGSVQAAGMPVVRADWESAMLADSPCLGKIAWTDFCLNENLGQRIRELVRAKYATPAYNQRR